MRVSKNIVNFYYYDFFIDSKFTQNMRPYAEFSFEKCS